MESSIDFQTISIGLSYISTISWSISQFPQQYRIYKLKKKAVHSLSKWFLFLWLMGDLCNFIGCILTDQLKFQLYLSTYFLCNDLILISQYYYYKYHYHGTEDDNDDYSPISRNTSISSTTKLSSMVSTAAVLVTQPSTSSAFPITQTSQPLNEPTKIIHSTEISIGRSIAWSSTIIYISSRMPQLYKNYKLKTVEGISPILFGSALIGNLTYTLSILTSPDFIYSDNPMSFLKNELPYILGSSGTILFDMFYFYQRWLYSYNSIITTKYTTIDSATASPRQLSIDDETESLN